STTLDSLLIEVRPRGSDLGFGAYRFLQKVQGINDLDDLRPVVQRPPRRSGQLRHYFPDPTCIPRPVKLTLVPRERALGLDVQRYQTESTLVTRPLSNEQYQAYSLRVPPGDYDLYFQEADPYPEDAAWTLAACAALVPQLARGIRVAESGQLFRNLTQTGDIVRSIEVRVPGAQSLEEWSVDVVNKRTGERLSTQGQLARGE